MYIKYLSLVTINYWLKALLPIFLLAIVFLLNGFIVGQVDNFFSKQARKTRDIFKVQLGGENAAFASALSKEKDLVYKSRTSYTGYMNDGLINKQRNSATVIYEEETKKTGRLAINKPILRAEPVYSVSSIFIGKIRKYAVINNKLVKIGDRIWNDEKVIAIEEGKVRVAGPWGERWLFVKY